MLSLQAISKTFASGLSSRKAAIHDLSFTVPEKTVLGFLGPNGAGKSTTIKMVMDFIRPDKGDIRIFGQSHRESVSRKRVGFLPEHPYYYDNLTARELLDFLGKAAGIPASLIRSRGDALLDRLQLVDAADKLLRSYSKGMQQRAGFAAALLHDPDLLILDEPLSGLDPIGRHMIITLLMELKQQGKTIFFSSHILNDIERLCDSVAILNQGRLLFHDSLAVCTGNGATTLESAFVSMITQDDSTCQ
ncbi:MAG: ABC transporter ATP-binding protein [Thermodesulfobacteriota bacterium]